jgi:hypothetical protein
MTIRLHPHARSRLASRGATEAEIVQTVETGRRSPARFDRTRFRRDFPYGREWRGRVYGTKQVDAFAVEEDGDWLVITVITRFF